MRRIVRNVLIEIMGGGGSSNLIFSKNPAGVLLIRNWVGSKSSVDKIVSPAARLDFKRMLLG